MRGYKEALINNNVPFDEKMIVSGSYRFQGGYDKTDEIVALKPEVILTANDVVAFGVMKRLSELNIKVPNEISICGYDDHTFSAMATVPLTTMRQDTKTLGRNGVDLLIKQIKHEGSAEQIVLNPLLIKRDSVRKNK